ncbi:MAG: hypothetical protein WD341_12120 [Tistlia sp.]|uniref:hypothetical protein n=1 Tax=Tistlia sp. TaxID=3057121 RepID=UPI0034A2B630
MPARSLPVLLRAGVHDDYDRLVFDWPAAVDFALEAEGIGTARIRFAGPGRLDASLLAKTATARLRTVTASDGPDGLSVHLGFPSGVRARAFSLGDRIVVDLVGPAGSPQRPTVELLDGPLPSATAEASGAPAAASKMPVPLVPQEATVPPAKPAGAASEPRPETPAAEAAPERRPPPPNVRVSEPAGFQIDRTDLFGRRVATPLPGGTAPWPEPVVLRFDWPQRTRAAVLQSGPAVLLVFDGEAPGWATRRLETLAPELVKLERHELESGTAFSFEVSTLVAPLLRPEGRAWVLDLRPRPALLDQPLPLTPDAVAQALRIGTEDAGTPIALRDPATGGRIYAVPLGENAGFAPARRFPQFEILSSPQGLFVAPLSDRVTVDSTPRRVTVAGLGAVPLGARPSRTEGLASDGPTSSETGRRLFDPAAWRLEARGGYSEVRQQLQTAVATARTAGELTAARLALARFYFGYGLAKETLGLLKMVVADDPRLSRDPELLLMAGASRTLAGDYEEAVEILGDGALVAEPEARLWQGLLAAAAQDWPVAADRFADSLPLTASYARAVRVRFALAAADARREIGDTATAEDYLKQIEPQLRTDLERARHSLAQAMTLLADGQPDPAETRLKEVAAGGYGSASARARLLLIERALADGSLLPAQAIEEIEKLRFAWRGDGFEFALLMRLADLYEAEGRGREALRRLRAAASSFPGNPETERAAIRMQDLFADLFTGAAAASMSPLAALSLYDEFRELTPPGLIGDAIIESLADRLVEIDLLDRAADLLDEQVAHRLSGLEKSRVAARLALVRLLDGQPAAALAALDASALDELPAELRLERARLRAKAMVDLGQDRTALDLLAGDDSAEADRLRVEIARSAGRWAEVATTLGRHLPPAGQPLDESDAAQVVNAAVAHVLAGQRAELQSLARRYAAEMAVSPHADTFELLAGAGALSALSSISEQLGQVEQAQAFMTDYRERLVGGSLSALN